MEMPFESIDAFVEQLPMGILVLDGAGVVVTHNRAALSLLNIDVEDLLVLPLGTLVKDPEFAAFVVRLGTDESTRQQAGFQVDGKYITCRGCAATVAREKSVVLALEDATQMHRLDTIKQEFLGAIVHKIRAPLSTLKTALSVLYENRPDNLSADAAEVIDISRHEVERLNRLLNGLRDLFAIETGIAAKELEFEEFAIGKSIERALHALEKAGRSPRQRLSALGTSDSMIRADFQRMTGAIEILIDNALIFSQGPVEITVQRLSTCVTLSVKDTGIGIGAEAQCLLFSKFFREDNAVTRGNDGNGLCLFLARSWLEMMNGSISCESTPGTGATFVLSVPGALTS